MTVKQGVDLDLEAEADEIIRQSLEGVTKYSEKQEILSRWKAETRNKRREQFIPSGLALESVRQGTYGRASNPGHSHLDSREGISGLRPRRPRPLAAWMLEQGYGADPGTPPEAER